MNINNMMNEGDVNNLEWLDETETFNPSNMGLSNVEEMKLQWDRDLKPETKEKIVKRKVNELLNQGVLGRNVMSSIKKIFAKQSIPLDIKKYVKARNGVVGTVLVDCGALNDGSDYIKSKKGSEFKSFHQYAINCKCDHKTANTLQEVNLGGQGNIDGLLNSTMVKSKSAQICSKTGLPVLSSANKYSSTDALKVLERLAKSGYITVDDKKAMLVKNNPLVAVKKAFNLIIEKEYAKSVKKYSSPVENEDFAMEEKGMFVDSGNDIQAPDITGIGEKDLEVEVMSAEDSQDVEIESKEVGLNHKSKGAKDDLAVDINKKESMNIKQKKVSKNLDVKISRKERNLDLAELDGEGTAEVCDICECMDVEVEDDSSSPMLEVDSQSSNTDLDIMDELEEVDIDGDDAVDTEWYEKKEMFADPCGEEDFEYLDVKEDSKFNF